MSTCVCFRPTALCAPLGMLWASREGQACFFTGLPRACCGALCERDAICKLHSPFRRRTNGLLDVSGNGKGLPNACLWAIPWREEGGAC